MILKYISVKFQTYNNGWNENDFYTNRKIERYAFKWQTHEARDFISEKPWKYTCIHAQNNITHIIRIITKHVPKLCVKSQNIFKI